MQCYECARLGTKQEAVGLCKRCQAGLCQVHLRETALYFGAGGTSLDCPHGAWRVAGSAAITRSGVRAAP
jgi:hypothetical protein